MPTTTGSKFGDIVLVPFPFTDQSATKKRPAIVVSSDAYHRERSDLILAAVTSQVRPALALGEFALASWKDAGLLKPSVMKPVIATVERGLVLRTLGTLTDDDRVGVRRALLSVFGE
jgi:mRNA interferase MazF